MHIYPLLIATVFLISERIQQTHSVKPLNNGHVGLSHFLNCREVVLSSEVKIISGKFTFGAFTNCPLLRGYLVFEVSFIGGSAVCNYPDFISTRKLNEP